MLMRLEQDQEGLTVQAGLMPMAIQDQPAAMLVGRIKVVAGRRLGVNCHWVKMVTTFGKPALRWPPSRETNKNYFVHLVAGVDAPLLNGLPVGQQPVLLNEGDQITLDGTVLQFSQC